jgi:hypothetical protein
MILQVVRAFSDPDIIHVTGEPKPVDDIEIINLELIFKDLETLQNHVVKVEKKVKGREQDAEIELALVKKLLAMLSDGRPAKDYSPQDNEKIFLHNLNLLSAKPTLYIINCSSEKPMLNYPAQCQPALEIDIKLENELSELPIEEAREMRQNLPHPKHNLDDLITACYALLKLESFFTTGEDETRAWTIKKGSRAPEAAGKIHTDFEQGFIRADVIFWQDLISAGSWHEAKEKGFMRTEGKEYLVRDGDVMIFKFN